MVQETAVVVMIQEATNLLVSHTVPVYPTKHVQSKASTKSTHVALFWQGSERHSSISENEQVWCRNLWRSGAESMHSWTNRQMTYPGLGKDTLDRDT